MTLTTSFFVLDPVDPRQAHDHLTGLVGGDSGSVRSDEITDGRRCIWNQAGIGLAALCWTYAAVDGPLGRYVDPDYPDGGEDVPFHYCVKLNFDTPYGFRTPSGGYCSDLHAWLVTGLAVWCDDRHLRWAWHNEFTDEFFFDLGGLTDFGRPELGCLRLDT